jgi:hypothetical protein
MNGSRFVFLLAVGSGVVSAAPGCAKIAGFDGDYRHVTSGGTGALGGAAGLAGKNAGSSGTSAGTAGDSGAGGDAGAAGSDAGGTGGGSLGTGGASAGTDGGVTGKGGASTGTGGNAVGAGGGSGGQGGERGGAGGSAGNGASAGMSGSAGAAGSWAGPVRIGYSEFHDSASGPDDASGHLLDATFEKPAGTQEGDLMLVFFGVDHNLNITNNDLMLKGWTLVDAEEGKGEDGQGTYLMYKFAAADEPQSIVFQNVNYGLYGVQGLLSVYRGVNQTSPVNAYDVVVVDTGTDGPTRIDTATPAVTTTLSNCLLLAGLSPDSAVDAPVVATWPPGFGNDVSVNNPEFPRPDGWANIYLAERTWDAPATFPAASISWDIEVGTRYYGALSFVLALAPEP